MVARWVFPAGTSSNCLEKGYPACTVGAANDPDIGVEL